MNASVPQGNRLKNVISLETRAAPLVLLLPLVITLLVITIFPTVFALRVSLMDYHLDSNVREFAGFANFQRVFGDLRFWNGMKNTIIFTVGSVSLELVLGMCIALLLSKQIFGTNVLNSLILIPMISTPVVISLIWILFLNPQFGLLNYFFSALHLPPQAWLSNPNMAIWVLVMIDVWEWTPFAILVFMAGLRSIPISLYEAAAIDGANALQSFRFITLPSLQPFILIVTAFRFMDAFRWFDTIATVTQGGPGISTETWSLYSYIAAFDFLDMGYSAALGVIMLIVVIVISQLLVKKIFSQQ